MGFWWDYGGWVWTLFNQVWFGLTIASTGPLGLNLFLIHERKQTKIQGKRELSFPRKKTQIIKLSYIKLYVIGLGFSTILNKF